MKKLSVNHNPLNPTLIYELNTFVNTRGARENQFQMVQQLTPKIEEALKLIGQKNYWEGRIKINEVLAAVEGWGNSSSLDPMID